MKIQKLNWSNPVGRNAKGQFVSLKNITVAEVEAKEETAVEAKVEAAAPAPKEKKERKPRAPKGPVVEIVSAIYGATVTEEEKEVVKNIDVTANVKVGRKVTNLLCGADPAPKVKKTLSVKALIDGSEVEKVFNEGEKLIF